MNRTTRWIAVAAGAVALAVLFLLLRPGEDPPDDDATPTTPAATTASATPTGSPTTTVPPSPTPTVVEIEVAYANGDVDGPERVEVDRGETVRLTVTSDVPEEVHVHGYDLTAEAGPGAPAVIEFVADVSGVFEVELEDSHRELFQLVVGA